jgi:hypothetical protein
MSQPLTTEENFRATCNTLVESLVGKAHAATWWTSPNRAFDNRTPETQWSKGSDTVVDYLMHHAYAGGGS